MYTAIIKKGMGKGALFIPHYQEKIKLLIHWTPYPGTLNCILDKKEQKQYNQAKTKAKSFVIPEFQHLQKSFGKVTLIPINIPSIPNAAIIIPEKTTHAESVVEIIADKNIMQALQNKEGDTITFAFR